MASKRDKTLDPTTKTFKRLFGLSGNQCAFPDCSLPMVHETGTVLGEACHIKGRRPNTARYDPDQSEDDRRSFKNLILMCSSHNKVVDDPDNLKLYPVGLLQKWKSEHEARHSETHYEAPHQAVKDMMSQYRVQMERSQPLSAQEFKKIRDWFVQEGPTSYQGGGRIPWRGIKKFKLSLDPPIEEEGLKFRQVHAEWEDGRTAIIELDESWFIVAQEVEMDSPEAEDAVHKALGHNFFRTIYREFETGQPFSYWYYKASRSANGNLCVGGTPHRPKSER